MHTNSFEELKHMLCREIDNIVEKGELSAGDLEAAHKLTDTIKNVDKITMLEEVGQYSGDDMNSQRSYRNNSYGNYGNSYRYDNARDGRGRYSGDGDGGNYSGARYVRGYYRDGLKDRLHELMQEAGTDKERKAIQKCIDSME